MLVAFVGALGLSLDVRSVRGVRSAQQTDARAAGLCMMPFGEQTRDAELLAAQNKECLLLPKEPFPGIPQIDIVGEVMLQELEDDEETRTQLILNPDGTISHGETDGPIPAGFCGLWQCGEEMFQMTLSRAFSTSPQVLERGMVGAMTEDITYSVVRVYEGPVDTRSSGVGLVNGRIDLVNDDDAATWCYSQATSIETHDPFSSIETPAIGYFVLDVNTIVELERDEGE